MTDQTKTGSKLKSKLTNSWVLIGIGVVIGILLGTGFLLWRVAGFVGETTGGGRLSEFQENSNPASSQSQMQFPATPASQVTSLTLSVSGTPAATTTAGLATKTPAPVSTSSSPLVNRIKRGETVTFMLAGYGGNNHAGEWLTDTILLLRFDPKSGRVVQVNIPRDLYVYIPFAGSTTTGGKWSKINTVLPTIMDWDKPDQEALAPKYRWGSNDQRKQFDIGMNLLADTIEPVTGYRIDGWAALSFEGFRRFIDSMGGVDVNVERYFIDRKYPRNDNDQVDAGYVTVEFYPGKQKLNGERAIRYARSRYSETPEEEGDFARSKRQMNLINSVKNQALNSNLISKSLDYMQALQGKIRLSLDLSEMVTLASFFNGEGKPLISQVKFVPYLLNDKLLVDTSVNNAYVLLPRDGQGDYGSIRRYLRLATLVAGRDSEPLVQVLNGNGTPGIAGKFTDFLAENGFNLIMEQDGENRPDTVIFDYSNGNAQTKEVINRLQSYLPDLKVMRLKPEQRPENTPANVSLQICLGKDFRGVAFSQTSNPAEKPGGR